MLQAYFFVNLAYHFARIMHSGTCSFGVTYTLHMSAILGLVTEDIFPFGLWIAFWLHCAVGQLTNGINPHYYFPHQSVRKTAFDFSCKN
jgi:hypothetical protein